MSASGTASLSAWVSDDHGKHRSCQSSVTSETVSSRLILTHLHIIHIITFLYITTDVRHHRHHSGLVDDVAIPVNSYASARECAPGSSVLCLLEP